MRTSFSIGFMVWMLGTSTLSGATSFYVPPFPDKVRATPLIVRGITSGAESRWVKDSDGVDRIYTFTSLQITEVLKGSLAKGALIAIRGIGGEKDGLSMTVPGAAVFGVDEDVVLMLGQPFEDGSFAVLSMMMGRFEVQATSDGEALVGPGINPTPVGFYSEHDHTVADPKGAVAPPVATPWTLVRLRELVATQESDKPLSDSNDKEEKKENGGTTEEAGDSGKKAETELVQAAPRSGSRAPFTQILFFGTLLGSAVYAVYALRRILRGKKP